MESSFFKAGQKNIFVWKICLLFWKSVKILGEKLFFGVGWAISFFKQAQKVFCLKKLFILGVSIRKFTSKNVFFWWWARWMFQTNPLPLLSIDIFFWVSLLQVSKSYRSWNSRFKREIGLRPHWAALSMMRTSLCRVNKKS